MTVRASVRPGRRDMSTAAASVDAPGAARALAPACARERATMRCGEPVGSRMLAVPANIGGVPRGDMAFFRRSWVRRCPGAQRCRPGDVGVDAGPVELDHIAICTGPDIGEPHESSARLRTGQRALALAAGTDSRP